MAPKVEIVDGDLRMQIPGDDDYVMFVASAVNEKLMDLPGKGDMQELPVLHCNALRPKIFRPKWNASFCLIWSGGH